MAEKPIDAAYEVLERAILTFRQRRVGTVAALGQPGLAAANYEECFVRDFVPAALVCINDGDHDIIRNFLRTVLQLREREHSAEGHELQPGVMPASFRIVEQDGEQRLLSDFGERAIGRVAPVDSMMWWMLLAGMYVRTSGDRDFIGEPTVQRAIRDILHLCLRDTFEVFPTLLVPDGSFMIDRRLGVYGHPLEIQALFYGMLQTAEDLLEPEHEHDPLLELVVTRRQAVRTYIRLFYWLDLQRLNEIHRYQTEEFGTESINMLNIYPESIPDWVERWLPERAGYLVGNLGPGRMDFRFFALGNLLAIQSGLATEDQTQRVLDLYEERWDELVGNMPLKICYPALEGTEWNLFTGCDPKNVPWSYHNGGSWPALLWAFTAAALQGGRHALAERAYALAEQQLPRHQWPEYYDGRTGRLIGRRANLNQVWTATSFIVAHQLLEGRALNLFPYSEAPDHPGANDAPG